MWRAPVDHNASLWDDSITVGYTVYWSLPTIEGGIKCAEPLNYFVGNSFLGTVQNKVSIHDILEKAKVMLGNSATRDSDTGEKLQGV